MTLAAAKRQAAKSAARLVFARARYRRAVLELQRGAADLLAAEADFARRELAWRGRG